MNSPAVNRPFTPDRRSPVALFAQVHGVLLTELESGVWKPGDRFPTMSELTTRFAVSSITIRRVLRDLTENGYLLTTQGARTLVADRDKPAPRTPVQRRRIAIPFYAGKPHKLSFSRGPWTATLIAAIQQVLMNRGYLSTLLPFDGDDTTESLGITREAFDGLLILVASHTDEAFRLIPGNMPHVRIGKSDTSMASSYVTANFYAGGSDVARLMLDRKIDRFLFVMRPSTSAWELMRGFQETLLQQGMPSSRVNIVSVDTIDAEAGKRAAADFLKSQTISGRIGIFGSGDLLAKGACHACCDLGISIPDQAIVVGGSGLPQAADYAPPLTVLCYPFEAVAQHAVDALMRVITTGLSAGPGTELAMSIRLRRSTGD
jgi:DNA-binding LacI/PurR family transcriptional regulator